MNKGTVYTTIVIFDAILSEPRLDAILSQNLRKSYPANSFIF